MDSRDLVPVDVFYPESDGKPMADNTLEWDWMVKIVDELRELFAGQNVVLAGDLFWYPVPGNAKTVIAPDALVVFGRPPGNRGSYKRWEKDGLAPRSSSKSCPPATPIRNSATNETSTTASASKNTTSSTPFPNTLKATFDKAKRCSRSKTSTASSARDREYGLTRTMKGCDSSCPVADPS